MWQPDGELIQIEVGNSIVDAVTEPDRRGLLGKLFKEAPPKAEQIVGDIILHLRNYLLETEGILLPTIRLRDNSELQSNEVVIYIGLETLIFQVDQLNDIFNCLAWKVREYHTIASDKSSIRKLLDDSLECIAHNHYTYAFESYQKAYYHSWSQNYEFELIRCLSDSGNIRLNNGTYLEALSLLTQASQRCKSPNIVDASFKAQIGINTANAFRITNQIEQALHYYDEASKIAYYAGDSSLLFLSLMGIAEIHCITQNYKASLFALELSINLILTQTNNENYKIAFSLQKFITQIYQQLLIQKKENQNLESRSLFTKAKNIILSALMQSVIKAVVYKIFTGGNACSIISIFGRAEYNLEKSIFNAPTVVGERNIQNLI